MVRDICKCFVVGWGPPAMLKAVPEEAGIIHHGVGWNSIPQLTLKVAGQQPSACFVPGRKIVCMKQEACC